MREELSNATSKQQKAEQDREEAEMKIAEVSYIHLLISLVKKDLECWNLIRLLPTRRKSYDCLVDMI